MFGSTKTDNPARTKEAEWVPLAQASANFGMTAQGFGKVVRPLLPASGIRNAAERGKVRIHMPTAIEAYIGKQVAQAQAKCDALLSGPDSPALERFRTASAELKEMERDRAKGQLVPRDELDVVLGQIASVLRQAAATIQRQHGNAAGEIIGEALDETMKQFETGGAK